MIVQTFFIFLYLCAKSYFVCKLYKDYLEKKVDYKFIILVLLIYFSPILSVFTFDLLEPIIYVFQPFIILLYFTIFEKNYFYLNFYFSFFMINTVAMSQTTFDVFFSSITGDKFFHENMGIFGFTTAVASMYFINYYFKKINFSFLKLQAPQYEELLIKMNWFYLALYLALRFSDLLSLVPEKNSTASMITLSSFVLLMYSIYYLRDHQIKWTQQRDFEIQKEIAESVTDSSKNLFSSITVLKSFRHDFTGLLNPLGGAIKRRSMEEVERIYNSLFLTSNSIISSPSLDNFEFLHITDVNIRGLFETAFAQSQELELDFKFESKDVIGIVDLPALELNRVVQIILNNAVEAASESEEKLIRVAIFKDGEEVILIVKNSFKNTGINMRDIYQNGFSTKGENRGIGLYTVSEIVANNQEITIDTNVRGNIFEQIVHLENKGINQ